MKKISAVVMPISGMSPQDAEKFMDWVFQMRPLNLFDPDVIGYPRTVMLRAESEDEPLLYVPLQSVLMFDSIAPKPGLPARQEALCLARIGEVVDQAAEATGHREVYFFCRDERVADLCAAHGYEEIKGVRLLKKKIQSAVVK